MATIVKSGICFARQALPVGPSKGISDFVPVDNYETITFLIEYTRGAAGGGCLFYVEASNNKVDWYQVAALQPNAIVAGTDATILTQKATLSYLATGVSTERFTSPSYNTVGHWMRISIGDQLGLPGIAQVEFFLEGDN